MVHWAVVRFVVAVSGAYVGWLVLFERWFEPWLRQCASALLGSSIVWVPAGGRFRIWGLRERRSRAINAAVGFSGAMTVLLSALLPVAALLALAAKARAGDVALTASSYLISLPMVAFFAFRVSSLKPEAQGQT